MADIGNRILILVPHPDDEVVACAAAIRRAKAQGAEIFAYYLTHGCIARETMWPWQRKNYNSVVARRFHEATVVAKELGLTITGFASDPARSICKDLQATYQVIRAKIAELGVDQLWVPAYEGGNADHDAINALASLFKNEISVLEFAEYNYANGKAHAQTFPAPNGKETILLLTPEEQAEKRRLLDLYQSEQKNLGYVGTKRECYRPLADYDYAKPPHEGTLWYARFQWVPFEHPRVDFTKPKDVCAAIVAFLASLR